MQRFSYRAQQVVFGVADPEPPEHGGPGGSVRDVIDVVLAITSVDSDLAQALRAHSRGRLQQLDGGQPTQVAFRPESGVELQAGPQSGRSAKALAVRSVSKSTGRWVAMSTRTVA